MFSDAERDSSVTIIFQYGNHQEELQKIRSSMRRKNREGSAPTKSFSERMAEKQVVVPLIVVAFSRVVETRFSSHNVEFSTTRFGLALLGYFGQPSCSVKIKNKTSIDHCRLCSRRKRCTRRPSTRTKRLAVITMVSSLVAVKLFWLVSPNSNSSSDVQFGRLKLARMRVTGMKTNDACFSIFSAPREPRH